MAVIDIAASNGEIQEAYETAITHRMADGTLDGSLMVPYYQGRTLEQTKAKHFQQYSTQDLIDTWGASSNGSLPGQDPVYIQQVLANRSGAGGWGWHNDSIRADKRIATADPNMTPEQKQQIAGIMDYTQQSLQHTDDESQGTPQGTGQAMFPGAVSGSFRDINSSSALRQFGEDAVGFAKGLAVPVAGAAALYTGGALIGGALGAGAGTAAATGGLSTGGAITSAVPGFEALGGIAATPLGAGGAGSAAGITAGAGGAGSGLMAGIKGLVGGGDVAGITGKQLLGMGQLGLDAFQGFQQGKMQDQFMQNQSGSLAPMQVMGPGGVQGSFGPQGGASSLGDLDPIRQSIMGSLGQQAGAIPTGIPQGVQDASGAFQQALATQPGANLGQLNQFGQMAGSQLNQGNAALNQARQPFNPGLQQAAFGGAQNFINAAGQSQQGVQDDVLANLRAQAAPHEQQQMNKLGEALFGSGRTGTTGGALQTEAMAKGLSQADLQRQLAARGEGRTTGQFNLQQGTGLAGVGGQNAQLGDQLLDQAFGRFGQSMGLASDLEANKFGRQNQLSNQAVDRTGQSLQNQQQMAAFLPQLQQQFQQPISTGLAQQAGLQTQAMQPFAQALQASGAAGNLAVGQGANISNMMGSANFSANPLANTFSGILGGIQDRT